MKWWFALYGILALLALKYIVVGLDVWNSTFHPGRIEPEYLNMFSKPFLGVFQQ